MSTEVKVVFFLSSEDLDPGMVTRVTKISPTSEWRKDDPTKRNNLVRESGRWEISTGYQESLDVGVQLNLIYETIWGSKQHLKELIEKHKLYAKFDVVIKIGAHTPAFFIGKEFLDLVHYFGAVIEVDLFTK